MWAAILWSSSRVEAWVGPSLAVVVIFVGPGGESVIFGPAIVRAVGARAPRYGCGPRPAGRVGGSGGRSPPARSLTRSVAAQRAQPARPGRSRRPLWPG